MKKIVSIALCLALLLGVMGVANAAHTPEGLLKSIKHLAEEGGILNCEFTAKDCTIDDVIDEYGQPDRDNYVKSAKGSYATFSSHAFVAGYGKGD